ncbi:unnamed protein product [Caenorhabditis nigoni]
MFLIYQRIIVTSLRLYVFYEFESYDARKEREESYVYGNQYDFFTTPVMIQMSYLFSNKRNLDTIKNMFKRKNRIAPSGSIGAAQSTLVDN